jgi:hypothetical protein
MWIASTVIGIVLFVIVGILVGFGSFLPWVIIPITIGSVFILPLFPASWRALKEYTREQEEFDDEHGI